MNPGVDQLGLNTYPLCRPALQSAYTKISRKQISHAQVYLNQSIICDFHWLAGTIEESDGIHILEAIEWDRLDVNLIVYSDVSLKGLGFCIPDRLLGFCASTPDECPCPMIFYFEALAIMLAILWASSLSPLTHRLLIYTDSLNCVEMFNSLSAEDSFNELLLFSVCILMSTNILLCVFHIPGVDNVIADALSPHLLGSAAQLLPGLQIHHFQPPHIVLGRVE